MLSPSETASHAVASPAPVPATQPAANDFLFRAVDGFLRQIGLFLLCFAVVTGLVAAALILRERAFGATVNTQVVTENIAQSLNGNGGGYDETAHAAYHVARFQDLVSDNQVGGFVDTALANARLARPINLDPRVGDVERYRKLMGNLYTTSDSDKVFTIGLVWDDPAELERIITSLQQQYVEAVGAGRQAKSLATVTFLDGEIRGYADRLKKAESALIDYKRDNYGQLPQSQDSDIKALSDLQQQLQIATIQVQSSRMKEQSLRERLATLPQLMLQSQLVGDSAYTVQIRKLQTQISDLKAKGLSENNDAVLNIREEMNRVRAAQEAEQEDMAEAAVNTPGVNVATGGRVVQNRTYRANPEYAVASQAVSDVGINRRAQEAQISLLKSRIREYQGRVSRIPAEQKALNDRTRDYTILKQQYEDLLEQREKARINANLDRATAQSSLKRIGAIRAESTANKKKTVIMLAASVFLGLLVGLCMVVLAEWADTSFRYASDTNRLLGVPLLAAIPRQKEWLDPATTGKRGRKR